jgi:hypothetical protein
MGKDGVLSPSQARAVAALLEARNVGEAAEKAHVPARTIYRWLQTPAFVAALRQAEGEMLDGATRRLLGMQQAALDAIEDVLQDTNTPPAVRVQAARVALDGLLRLRDALVIEARLQALEGMIGNG